MKKICPYCHPKKILKLAKENYHINVTENPTFENTVQTGEVRLSNKNNIKTKNNDLEFRILPVKQDMVILPGDKNYSLLDVDKDKFQDIFMEEFIKEANKNVIKRRSKKKNNSIDDAINERADMCVKVASLMLPEGKENHIEEQAIALMNIPEKDLNNLYNRLKSSSKETILKLNFKALEKAFTNLLSPSIDL